VELRSADGLSIPGKIHDISESGISVESEAALAPGQSIEVDCGGLVAGAVVRHCAPQDGRFRIGLELYTSP
jgi:PilZ domain